MKPLTCHSILVVLFFVCNSEISFSMGFQDPNQNRTFDTRFKERYTGRRYEYEGKKRINAAPKAKVDRLNNSTKEVEQGDGFSIHLRPLSWLFYLAIFGAILYLVYILLHEGGSGLFAAKGLTKIERFEAITSDNIENTDINALINQAEVHQEYRLAIRYYYLLVLKTLALKNHLRFEDDKTNADYLNDLGSKPFSQGFAQISYLYNYIWYGEFPIDSDQYAKAKRTFVNLLNQVK